MGLAGNMKFSTFVTTAVCVTVLGVTAAVVLWPDRPPTPDPEPVSISGPEGPHEVLEVPEKPEAGGSQIDAEILTYVGQDLGEPKKKDVSSGKPYKINVYQDEGHSTANRAKVDLDRDDKWDIKVTFDEAISRKLSSQDDENYDVEEIWNGEGWARPGAEPAEEPQDPVVADLMRWVGKDLGSAKLKDVTQGKPYKINVYQDDGHGTANRAKVDLDRDDKWDIKVTFDDTISRKVSSGDDENYDLEQVWSGEDWVSP